ncbi:ferritin [Bacillus badius]|uniref:Ferritin n=1 Tax=Bacillus badius TaxID=1455 RepID=A0ABR5AX93_BACBA|nr:ferritin [Bacillus badius]KIL76075.1 Ferritin, Dps family protein [Bacillus badius]KIL79361.1 Ferritin, Dps family protein [Bacillus badius]KZO00345.1 ferritin [Bacillus badius]KZR59706.1 ferritin [Bacillus badius]MED0668399.1 ferritin [Bacillus badius]
MLNEQIQKLLNNLIQVEHVSTTLYLAMSAYMASRNYTGMARWLRLQAEEERTHMLKLIDYVTDRGGQVEIQALPAQPAAFGTPLETFQKVLEHERFVTNSYRQAYNYAAQHDQQTAVLFQEFLREQVDEEAQAQTIVDRLKLAQNNPAALLILDQELGRRTAAAPGPAAGG